MYGAEKLTKEYILSRVSEESIMGYYLGIPVQFSTQVKSPLRVDKVPTCGFAYDVRGVLKFRDFSGDFHGDCFDVVMRVRSCNFYQALVEIRTDLLGGNSLSLPSPTAVSRPVAVPKTIAVRRQPWTVEDIAYWSSYGIRSATLNHYGVAGIANAWVNDKMVYVHRDDDPGYVYVLRGNKHKLYFPKRTSYRFLVDDASVLQGWDQLPESGKLLVITKSLKDVMVLYQHGIPAVAPASEGTLPRESDLDELRQRFATVVVFYDYDLAGIRAANVLRRRYQLPAIFLTKNFKSKDISDFQQRVGVIDTHSLLTSCILWLHQTSEPSTPTW